MINTADQKLMRKINSKTIIDLLRQETSLSRANLSSMTGLTRSTVSSIITDLISDGWVKETTYQSGNVGRPGLSLALNSSGGFAVGLEIGVDFILVVCVDFSTKVIWDKNIQIDPKEQQTKILEKALALTSEAIAIGEKNHNRSLGIGIAVPGLVDVHKGVLKFAPNLGWREVPLGLIWSQRFHVPVYIENEANAAALGEYNYGAAQGINHLIYMAAGYGLGSGIIIDGVLLRGNKGYASEVGHMTSDPEGSLCNCGKRGCYETIIGPRAVIERVQKIIQEEGGDSSFPHDHSALEFGYDAIVEAAKQYDKVALLALESVGKNLGIVVANLVNIFNPKMVILGGALNYAKEYIQPVVRDVVKENALQLCQEDLLITHSELDPYSAVMGTISLIYDEIFSI